MHCLVPRPLDVLQLQSQISSNIWIASDGCAKPGSRVTLHVYTHNYDVPSPLPPPPHTHTHTYTHSHSSISIGLKVRGEAEVILVALQGQRLKVWLPYSPPSFLSPLPHTTSLPCTTRYPHPSHTPPHSSHTPLIQRRLDMVDLC